MMREIGHYMRYNFAQIALNCSNYDMEKAYSIYICKKRYYKCASMSNFNNCGASHKDIVTFCNYFQCFHRFQVKTHGICNLAIT